MTTDFSNVCEILGQFYVNYRDDNDLGDFIEFNDLGLPLAYLSAENLCEPTEDGTKYILETWELLLASLQIEDTGFVNLAELFEKAEKK
jgi:hypothetical protein